MTIEAEAERRKGVIPIWALLERGITRHRIDQAVQAGALHRIRQGWVATPKADPELVLAARGGVVLTCISQARRRGLWVLAEPELHVAAPRPGSKVGCPGATIHWGRPVKPRVRGELEDSIENVLGFVASCQTYEVALAVWDSALNTGLVDLPKLAQLPFRGVAQRLVAECSPYADSGLESFVRIRLRWLCVPIEAQAWILGHRVDFLIGGWLVLQIDGAHHTGAQRTEDIRHDAELMQRGYEVIRCSYEQVVHRWQEVQGFVMDALSRRGLDGVSRDGRRRVSG